MLGQPQMLPQISVKGYRELLKRLRQQSNEEAGASSALFQQAKQLALAHLQRKRGTEKLDPKRAFTKLRQRIVAAKKGLKDLKDEKKVQLRAKYVALREQAFRERSLGRKEAADEVLVLGSNGLSRALVLGAVSLLSRGFMTLLNSLEVEGGQRLQQALERPLPQGLLTVSNHTAALDDPLLLAAMMPHSSLLHASEYRWGMCATDRCFKNSFMAAFFRAGKTLPVERGAGMEQPGVRAAEGCLNSGDWVHIFPEGTRSRDGKMGPMRRGVGHLISACQMPPVVLPFVHSGMESILPTGSSLPKCGQKIRVLVGEPIVVADLLSKAKMEQWSDEELSTALTRRVGEALYGLKARLERVSVAEVLPEKPTFPGAPPVELMPLIEEQMDGLKHSWRQQPWHQQVRPAIHRRGAPHSYSQIASQQEQGAPELPNLQRQLEYLRKSRTVSLAVSNLLEVYSLRSAMMRGLAPS